jgi:hypothetical protein
MRRKARLLGGLLAAALMFPGSAWTQDDPSPTPTPTPTPECTPATMARRGCYDAPNDPNAAMNVPPWSDDAYETSLIGELVALRQDVVALRRFMVIMGGALLGWSMMAFLFDAITGRR